MKALLPLFLLAALSACQKDEISVRRVAKEDAPAMPGAAAAAPARGVRWTAPAGWAQKAGAGMRAATLVPPPSAGKAEVTVVVLPGDVGGELANVNRWRGQIALPPLAAADLAAARTAVVSPLGSVSVYDFTSGGTPRTRLVAGLIRVDGSTWFFKLMGDEKAVAADKPAFVRMLGGLARDAS